MYSSVTITLAMDVQVIETIPTIFKYTLNSHLHTTEQYFIMFVNTNQIAKDKSTNLFHLWNYFFG